MTDFRTSLILSTVYKKILIDGRTFVGSIERRQCGDKEEKTSAYLLDSIVLTQFLIVEKSAYL